MCFPFHYQEPTLPMPGMNTKSLPFQTTWLGRCCFPIIQTRKLRCLQVAKSPLWISSQLEIQTQVSFIIEPVFTTKPYAKLDSQFLEPIEFANSRKLLCRFCFLRSLVLCLHDSMKQDLHFVNMTSDGSGFQSEHRIVGNKRLGVQTVVCL